MSLPFLFSAKDPLLIRPLQPHGFSLETLGGVVLFTSGVDYSSARFTMLPGPAGDQAVLEIEMNWLEHHIDTLQKDLL